MNVPFIARRAQQRVTLRPTVRPDPLKLRLQQLVRAGRISPAQASSYYVAAARARRPTTLPVRPQVRPQVLPRRDPVTDAIYSLAAKAPVPFISQILQVNKLVESLPMPAQIALAPLILTPGLVVKAAGAIADAGTAVVDFLGDLFGGGGYTQAELDRNHALAMAGMTPQPKDPGPGRRTVVP